MKNKTVKYTDNPEIGELKAVEDFLPPPEELANAEVFVNVTVRLPLETINFIQAQAKQHNTSYQRIIERVLDDYAAHARTVEEAKHA